MKRTNNIRKVKQKLNYQLRLQLILQWKISRRKAKVNIWAGCAFILHLVITGIPDEFQ